ncbi:class I SAM-dependent methyltransferase [Actinomycetospora sp. CA-101289]|uniref:class I SAM-dependent methyltransferase n=1 Tax=Actinomycetospora sp. CA-101289 TaxID=3239893 RepID=UPI003D99BEB6
MSQPDPARPFLPAMSRDALLPYYDAFSRLLGAGPAHARLVAQADPPPDGRVLEIGCGTGNVLARMARARPDVALTGLDPDAAALERARAKLPVGVRLERGYADALPLPDGSVDRVLSALMLHHMPPDEQAGALREVRRVLAPGGSLHLVDLETGGPHSLLARGAGALLRLVGRSGGGEGHGHGHAHGHDAPRPHLAAADDLLALLRDAGLVDAVVVGRRRWVLGTLVFYRASVPGPEGV